MSKIDFTEFYKIQSPSLCFGIFRGNVHNINSTLPVLQGEEGQSQKFLFRATFFSFFRPSHL